MYAAALLILALLVGWLATLIMQSDLQRICLVNFTVAIAGAAAGAGILAPRIGIATFNEYGFSVSGLLLALMASMLLVAAANWLRRGTLR